MNDCKGILRIRLTDDVSKVGIDFKGEGATVTIPSDKVSHADFIRHCREVTFSRPSIEAMAWDLAGCRFDKMIIEDGDYPIDVYVTVIPYLMGRVEGKMMASTQVVWKLMQTHQKE